MMSTHLFSPIELRGVKLKNRIVASPMWQYSGKDGMPTDTHLLHLGRLAEGGAGLVVQEGTSVDPTARGTVGDLGIWSDSMIPAYARLVRLMKAGGAVPGIQLIHAGRKARRNPPWVTDQAGPAASDDWRLMAPSPIPIGSDGAEVPTEMSLRDIEEAIGLWVNAARRAHEAGYEVLELQAAHGYLLHTFLSPLSNLRTDNYGGSAENRLRFLLEVIDGVRTVWPDDKALFVRLSCVDAEWTLDQTVALVRELQHHGVDLIDCSSGGLTGVPFFGAPTLGYGYQVPYSEHIRSNTRVMTMAVGYIVHARHAQEIIETGQADLVALGRELLHNPNWPIDAARKLGAPDPYAHAPRRIAHWLTKRDEGFADFRTSTEAAAFPLCNAHLD